MGLLLLCHQLLQPTSLVVVEFFTLCVVRRQTRFVILGVFVGFEYTEVLAARGLLFLER